MSEYVIEEESGTFLGRAKHAHNGYWAGRPPASSPAALQAWFAWGRTQAPLWRRP